MSRTIIGIDPGMGGAFAWVEKDEYFAVKMPDTPRDIAELVEDILVISFDPIAYIEKVHSMPRDGVASSFKFGRNVGVLHGMLAAFGVPMVEVSPQKWQQGMGLPTKNAFRTKESIKGGDAPAAMRILAQHKAARKRAIKEQMQARYPELKVTLKTADALAIMTWAINGGKW